MASISDYIMSRETIIISVKDFSFTINQLYKVVNSPAAAPCGPTNTRKARKTRIFIVTCRLKTFDGKLCELLSRQFEH